MPDLEARLAAGLHGAADSAPPAADLATGARVRLRRRRRTTAAVVAAALVVVAVPVGLTVAGGDGDPDRDTATNETVPDDWRVESYRDLTLRVPGDWAWGGGTDWCIAERDAASSRAVVSRPGVVRTIDCSPSYGYGVHFEQPPSGELPPGTEGTVQQYTGERYPDDSWLGYARTGRAGVWVVTADRQLTRQVLDTVEPIRGVDANGCPDTIHTLLAREGTSMSVCRYSRGGWLEQSELLSEGDSEALRAAVASAPEAEGSNSTCPGPPRPESVITLSSDGFWFHLGLGGTCPEESVLSDDQGTTKRLTEDVLYWALSPGWSGAVGAGVPLPERLRTE